MTITESRQNALAVAIANLESRMRESELDLYVAEFRDDRTGYMVPIGVPVQYTDAHQALVAWRRARVAELMEAKP